MRTTDNRTGISRIFSLLICFIVAFMCLLPAGAGYASEAAVSWSDSISELLKAAPYAEGSVIAGYQGVSKENLDNLYDGIQVTALYEISAESLLAAGTSSAAVPSLSVLAEQGETLLLAEIRSDALSTEALLKRLADDKRVLYAEPNYLATPREEDEQEIIKLTEPQPLTPHEQIPSFASYEWGLSDASPIRDFNLKGGTPSSSIHAINDFSGTGSNMDSTVYVAVIDEFADYNHPDLQNVLAHFTPEEQAALGCGEWGYNASGYKGGGQTANDFRPGDHGTHCCGLVGAAWDGHGIMGAASNVKIISIQISDPIDYDDTNPYDGAPMLLSSLLRALAFVDHYNSTYPSRKVRIISMSLGVAMTSRAFSAAIYELGRKHGTVSFLAAGNDTLNNDTNEEVHGNLRQNPYAIVVAALDQSGNLSNYSDYGKETVTLAAPGSSMLSTIRTEKSAYFPGLISDGSQKDIFYENFEEYDGKTLKIRQLPADDATGTIPNTAYTITGPEGAHWSGQHALSMKLDHSLCAYDPEEDGQYWAKFEFTVRLSEDQAEQIVNLKDADSLPQFGFIAAAKKIEIQSKSYITVKEQGAAEILDDTVVLPIARADYHGTGTWSVIASGKSGTPGEKMTLPEAFGETRDEDGGTTLVFTVSILTNEETDTFVFDSFGIGTSGMAYSIFDGTSMATPTAAGAGAVYASRHPNENGMELAARIRASVTKSPLLSGKVQTGGRVDLLNDVSGSWTMPGQAAHSWPLYETTLPLDVSTGNPFLTDAPGDCETYGPLVALNDRLYYMPAVNRALDDRNGMGFTYRDVLCFDTIASQWDQSRGSSFPCGHMGFVNACAWDGKLWVYGLESKTDGEDIYESERGTPHVYSYDPNTRVWQEHSLSGIKYPDAMVLFSTQNGLMFFHTHAGVDETVSKNPDPKHQDQGSTETDETAEIYEYNPSSGLGKPVVQIRKQILNPTIVTHDSTIWVASFSTDDSKYSFLYRIENGTATNVNLKMPPFLKESNPDYSPLKKTRNTSIATELSYPNMVAGEKALYIVGYTDRDKTADTWEIPYDQPSAMKPYGKHISVLRPTSIAAAYNDGKIYAIAADWGENDGRVFRSTRVEGEEPTPTPTPTATPTPTPTPTPAPTATPKPVPKTGDSAHPELWLLLIVIPLLAVLCYAVTGRKKSSKPE